MLLPYFKIPYKKKTFFTVSPKTFFIFGEKQQENSKAGKIFSSDNKKKSSFPDVNVQPTELSFVPMKF